MEAICTESGVMVITDVSELKRPQLAEKRSNVSQIALVNGRLDLPVCDTSLGSIRIVKYVGTITQHPKRKASISNLEIIGKLARFQPFANPYWLAKKRANSCYRSKCGCCRSFKSV